MQVGMAEFLEKVSKLKKKDEKVEALKYNNSYALRTILQAAFDQRLKFLLPEGEPPYRPNDLPDQESVLLRECRKLVYMIEGPYPNLKQVKREQMFIELLETVALEFTRRAGEHDQLFGSVTSSDIGNKCAIGNAYPTFEQGRKYLAPGLFGPCGYGFPSIIGAKIGNPDTPVVGFAGDGAFGISMSEMSSIGREDWPAITMVVFRNYQWGAEKRNSTLWYDDNFVGTELDPHLSYARVAEACGLKGVVARNAAQLTEAIAKSCEEQKNGVTTFIEVVLNQELGEPFRRDAMKKPVVVAGISREDMRPQKRA